MSSNMEPPLQENFLSVKTEKEGEREREMKTFLSKGNLKEFQSKISHLTET
jgi:hypothetical protein